MLASLSLWEEIASWRVDNEIVALGGHSLGQLTAVLDAGVLGLDDGLELAAVRAQASADAQAATPGGLVALYPTTEETVAEIVAAMEGRAWLANANGGGQFVVGAREDALGEVEERAGALGVRYHQLLPVDGAFHTPLMAPAAQVVAEARGRVRVLRFAAPAARQPGRCADRRRRR